VYTGGSDDTIESILAEVEIYHGVDHSHGVISNEICGAPSPSSNSAQKGGGVCLRLAIAQCTTNRLEARAIHVEFSVFKVGGRFKFGDDALTFQFFHHESFSRCW